jgi:hypothetical protein
MTRSAHGLGEGLGHQQLSSQLQLKASCLREYSSFAKDSASCTVCKVSLLQRKHDMHRRLLSQLLVVESVLRQAPIASPHSLDMEG